MQLYRLGEVVDDDGPCRGGGRVAQALREVAAWLDDYISRPHSRLGRAGDVCPWTRRAIELDTLWLTWLETLCPESTQASLLSSMHSLLAMIDTDSSQFRAVVTVFPLQGREVEDFVVATHARLKPIFLDHKLMLGEFFPGSQKPGLHNPQFHPLWSPWPLLVIRPMVEADVDFLIDRDSFVDAYLRAYGDRGRVRLAQTLRERPDAVEATRLEGLRRRARVSHG